MVSLEFVRFKMDFLKFWFKLRLIRISEIKCSLPKISLQEELISIHLLSWPFPRAKKKVQVVKNFIIVWYFGYKPLSNDKYIQKWAFQYAAFLTALSQYILCTYSWQFCVRTTYKMFPFINDNNDKYICVLPGFSFFPN